MSKKEIVSRAPARICLFGEHQDYLGLDVIASAVNLFFTIEARKREDNKYHIFMPDINKEFYITPSEKLTYENSRDYIKAVINILKREYGFDFKEGYDFIFKSNIPINAGASSSSVMLVAWSKLLLKIYEHSDYKNPEKVAYIAYQAEVKEFKEAGGMMDHYSSSLGNTLHIETEYNPVKYEYLDFNFKGFVLGHSLEPKDTVGVLKNLKSNVLKSISLIKEKLSDFSFKKYRYEEIQKEVDLLPSPYNKLLKANLLNHEYTIEFLRLIKNKNITEKKLGELLYKHHIQLRDGLNISTSKIERMLDSSLKAGALGGKINGSGGGGTMFVFAPGKEKEVAEAIKKEGGIPYILEISEGAKIIS